MRQRTLLIIGMMTAATAMVVGYMLNNNILSAQDKVIVAGEAMVLELEDGCYLLTGKAYEVFTLENKKATLLILKNQLEAIENPDALIIIGFEGYLDDLNSFIDRYEIKDTQVIKEYIVEGYSEYGYRFMQGLIKKSHLEGIVERLLKTPEVLGDPKNGVEATVSPLAGAIAEDGRETAKQYSMYLPINQIPPDKVGEVIALSKQINDEVVRKALNAPGVIKGWEC